MTLRIAVVKPDWGITGGFELLTDGVVDRLRAAGHDVRVMSPKVSELNAQPFGLDASVADERVPEYARYVRLIEQFRGLDLHRADLVISTQPPSYAIDHPRHISLFSHHVRCFYDLSDVMIEAGLVRDVEAHQSAQQLVHEIDAHYLPRVTRFLATSEEVQRRLADFNGLRDNVGVFHAGLGFQQEAADLGDIAIGDYALCVSRHEFPKRTELFVGAMACAGGVRGVSVGTGGRLGYVMGVAESLARQAEPPPMGRADWCLDVPWIEPPTLPAVHGAVEFTGFAGTAELEDLYRGALCVVAPAFLEDYGLTAIEAMTYGKPLVVCSDGGNLANLVEHGVTGLIVEPTGAAIGEAIRSLAADPGWAAKLGAAGRERAREYSWDSAMRVLESCMAEVMQ